MKRNYFAAFFFDLLLEDFDCFRVGGGIARGEIARRMSIRTWGDGSVEFHVFAIVWEERSTT